MDRVLILFKKWYDFLKSEMHVKLQRTLTDNPTYPENLDAFNLF